MSEAPLKYAVLISEPGHLKPVEIAKVLAVFRRVPVQDVVPAARKSWGILEENLEDGTAREMADSLKAAGLGAIALPQGLMEDLPSAQAVSKMPFSTEGLFPELVPGQLERIPWERLALIAAVGFKEKVVRRIKVQEGPGLARKALDLGMRLATGFAVGLGGGKREVEKTVESSDLVFYLDLILKDSPQRLRIDAQDFDFSCLRGRMAYNVASNFKILVAELAQHAPGATRNRGAQVLLDGKPLREMGYESLAELERESRWLLTLRAVKG